MLNRAGDLGKDGTRGLLTMGEAGRARPLWAPDTAVGVTNNGRADTSSTTAGKQQGRGRPRGHRLLLGNETVIKQKHIEGTTHAYDIFSPKQLKFGSGGSNGLTGRKSGGDS